MKDRIHRERERESEIFKRKNITTYIGLEERVSKTLSNRVINVSKRESLTFRRELQQDELER